MRPQDPFIGRDILNGQFQILQKIGSGGMGAVYKALQPEMKRMVGVKILHPKLADRKDLVSRFRREARALSQLSHPNTVRVFLYGELQDASLYIIMELLEGKNLNQTVRIEGPFAMTRALPILIQVCGALDEAHKAGIIHRDLKPENIFLVQSAVARDFPKVLDFGLAKVGERQMRPGSVVLTQEGMVFGTPEFMSPEQAQGKKLTPASDVYSLAVILYEVLTGKLPFDAKSTMDYIQLHVTGQPLAINQRVPDRKFPPLLEQILDRALAKRPEDRFESAADFGAAMQLVLDGAAELPPGLLQPSNRAVTTLQLGAIPTTAEANEALPAPAKVAPSALPGSDGASGNSSLGASLGVPAGSRARPSRHSPRKLAPAAVVRKNSVALLVGVAVAFLIVGAGLAILLTRLITR